MRPGFVPERPQPVRLPAMFQGWRRISFLHWPCDARWLQPRLPDGLTVDAFEEVAWIGLTPFHLTGLRPPFLPAIPGLSNFPEMNLRTYVRGPAGPGIWFFSLDAASLVAVLGARLSYGLPYHWATMRVSSAGRRVHYASARAGAAASITVEVGEPLADPDDLTLFLTERYRLYTRILGHLAMAPVEHEPWPLHRATLVDLRETVRRAAGIPGEDRPALVHWSPGVRVRVGWPRRPTKTIQPARGDRHGTNEEEPGHGCHHAAEGGSREGPEAARRAGRDHRTGRGQAGEAARRDRAGAQDPHPDRGGDLLPRVPRRGREEGRQGDLLRSDRGAPRGGPGVARDQGHGPRLGRVRGQG